MAFAKSTFSPKSSSFHLHLSKCLADPPEEDLPLRPRPAAARRPRPAAARRPRPAAARSPPPQTVNRAPRPAPVQASSGGGMFSNIMQGMAFATGSAVADRAVDAVMGPRTIRTIQHEIVTSEVSSATPSPVTNSMGSACDMHVKAFQDCLNGYGNDISKCQFYMDMLSECRKNSGSVMGA